MSVQTPGLRLKGQEVRIVVQAGNPPSPIATIDSVSEFNDETNFKLLEDGFLGEVVNRFDEVLDGYGGDFNFQVTNSGWITLQNQIIARATRQDPTIQFNVVRTDLFADGSSLIYTYQNVFWGGMPQKTGGRDQFVKVSASFKCGDRPVLQDQL